MFVINQDCIEGMRELPDNSIDAIVTDPPYELGFMGKSWDASGIAYRVELWSECLRVLKPGGHMLAFSGSRTYHRMTCAIEDAGFEIRDQIMWVYGSGFPKSLDVSKAIDKAAGVEREIIGANPNHRAVSGIEYEGVYQGGNTGNPSITAPATEAAQQWQGWGTALKPAHEPICVARKPLIGTVAQNVLTHGTGAINIDGCRVGDEVLPEQKAGQAKLGTFDRENMVTPERTGRWPANLIHDGSDEVVELFPREAGAAAAPVKGTEPSSLHSDEIYNLRDRVEGQFYGDSGSAARFFYSPKASKRDRDEGLDDFTPATTSDGRAVAADNAYQRGKTERHNIHPTVKPTALMRYLCRLITPPGGTILDPFAGSGSTGKAAISEGFAFIGFELSPEYTEIANARITHALLTNPVNKT